MKKFYSNGKLLLTGEYAILDGAMGLALPTKYGQNLQVSKGDDGKLSWKSYDADESIWFKAVFLLPELDILESTHDEIAYSLCNILKQAGSLNPKFLNEFKGYAIETRLSFSRNWGLGTSSTLINNIAQYASIDPYVLLKNTFGGSGYDIACAQYNNPIVFQLQSATPKIEHIQFFPSFHESLFFVYLNRKQNSREAIAKYRAKQFDLKELIHNINNLTQQILITPHLNDFERLLQEHESLLSKVLNISHIQDEFGDYFGQLKSLGAWGGDFILATGNEKTPDYFRAKGFDIVIPYKEMIR